ncbi:MAG: M48 family metallopeptidase [Methylophagaceae bacterium]
MMAIQGKYYDGKTANSQTVQLTLDPQGLLHADPDLISPIALSAIKISSRVANIPRTLSLPSGAIFETNDHDILDEWLARHQIKEGFIHKLENSMKYVIASVVFMVLFVGWTAFYGIPLFSTVAANALPPQVSIAIGDGVLETMDERFFTASELGPIRHRELTDKFTQLLEGSTNKGDIKYRLEFRKSELIGPNAFALPNGIVVLTDELVALAEHDQEIYSVLLHEIGHVEHRHSLRQLISHSGLAIITVLITGDVNSAGALILAMPNILMTSAYSRDIEWEADSYALDTMKKVGIPPSRFADFMERLEAYDPEYEFENDDFPEFEDGSSEAMENNIGEQTTTIADSGQETELVIVDNEEADESECISTPQDDGIQYELDLGWFSYLSTHPTTEDRIARFRDEAVE